MRKRIVKIDESLIKPLEDLIKNYPKPSTTEYIKKHGKPTGPSEEYTKCFNKDMSTYIFNQLKIDAVIDANLEFFSTKDIPEEEKTVGQVFLTVQPDMYVESLLRKARKLQDVFLNEVQGGNLNN